MVVKGRLYSPAEVGAAQGPEGNCMTIAQEDHVLTEYPMSRIYPDSIRAVDDLDGLYRPATATKLARALKAGAVNWQDVTPVVVTTSAIYCLADGHHRFAAFKIAGLEWIMAFVPASVVDQWIADVAG